MASANVGDCLSGAWGIFKNNAITHVVCTLLVMVVASISAGRLVMGLPRVALFLGARGGRDGVAAFNQAWSIVTKNLGSAFFCSLVLGIVGSLGFLLCGVGALLTLPLSTIGSYYMARQLVGDEPVALPPL